MCFREARCPTYYIYPQNAFCVFRNAPIFMDQFSGLYHVHLQESISANNKVEAKEAYEQFTDKSGVQVDHHHCDN